MASLGRLTGGGREGWRIRFSVMRQRKSLTLSRVSEATAKIWCKNIQHMSKCIDAKVARDDSVTEWIATLTAEQLDKLHAAGLITQGSKPQVEVKVVLLGEFLESALGDRQSSIKPRTYIALRTVADRLIEYFGATRSLATIRNEDARKFRTWLESANKRDKPKKSDDGAAVLPKLSPNTVRRRIGRCRQFFEAAVNDGLIDRNPFKGLPANVRSNKARQYYVDLNKFALVLAKAPNSRWRALLLLARQAALRIPSEAAELRWTDIDWETKRFLVRSPKTEHHEGGESRIVPLFDDLETELKRLRSESSNGSDLIFPDIDGNSNLGTTLAKIIARAAVDRWPKLWQNLRASGSTDFARCLPAHVAAAICGHTEQIAREHYWQVGNSDLDLARNLLPKVNASTSGSSRVQSKAIKGKANSEESVNKTRHKANEESSKKSASVPRPSQAKSPKKP